MIRTIPYTVTADTRGITPNTIQWAGMQYEDNATRVTFDLSALHMTDVLCRIDFNSDGAGYHPSENLALNNGKISREIPKYITQYGGELQVTAVVTRSDTGEVIYSYPVRVRFTAVDKSEYGNESVDGNISEMEESVRQMTETTEKAASIATEAAGSAKTDRELTEEARFALENGSVFIFTGGDAESAADTTLVIDGEMSDISQNPVMNKTVKTFVDKQIASVNAYVGDAISESERALQVVNDQILAIDNRLNTEADYIVEQGTKDGWTYRKWNSGNAECWTASCSIDCPITTAWGSLFVSDEAFPQIDYPITFVDAPVYSFELAYVPFHMVGYCFVTNLNDNNRNQHTPAVKVWSPVKNTTNQNITARISVKGRWK